MRRTLGQYGVTARALKGTCLAALLVVLLLDIGCAPDRRGGVGPVVEAAPLAAKLEAQDRHVLLLDARSAEAYATGHVAGAIHVDLDAWRVDSLSAVRGLDHATQWRQRIGALGIDGRTPVIVYDDGRMTEAARVWFILQHFGVADVSVVDGGYPALTSLTGTPRVAIAQTPTLPRPTTFTPHEAKNASIGLATRADVRAALDHGDAQILDVRTAAEYKGADKRKNPRGGHLPTAINLPHKQLLGADGHLKSPEEIGALLQAAGVRKASRSSRTATVAGALRWPRWPRSALATARS